jgi:hypothetical protein
MFGLDLNIGLIYELIPLVVASVAPKVTEVVKDLINGISGKTVSLPGGVKAGLNTAIAAVIAGACGSMFGHPVESAMLGSAVGVGSSLGFKVGKKS